MNSAMYTTMLQIYLLGVKSSQVSPSARRRAQCKGGGGKIYACTNDRTTCRHLSEHVVAACDIIIPSVVKNSSPSKIIKSI